MHENALQIKYILKWDGSWKFIALNTYINVNLIYYWSFVTILSADRIYYQKQPTKYYLYKMYAQRTITDSE